LFWRFGEQMALRQGDWKLVRYGENTKVLPNETWPKLYNLAEDIGESNDLAAKQPEKVKELQAAWDKWNVELVKPLWGGSGKKEWRWPVALAPSVDRGIVRVAWPGRRLARPSAARLSPLRSTEGLLMLLRLLTAAGLLAALAQPAFAGEKLVQKVYAVADLVI